jgi:hypothetical protein
MRAPLFTFKQKKIRKNQNKPKQTDLHADNNCGGLSNIPPIGRTKKHIPIGVGERMSKREIDGL